MNMPVVKGESWIILDTNYRTIFSKLGVEWHQLTVDMCGCT